MAKLIAFWYNFGIVKVLTAMSGGVDSAVAALLLKEQGYTPVGVTAKMWQGADVQDVKDAATVCEKLGIEHHVVDLCAAFHQLVISRFVQEYDYGRTPNPCVDCNKYIKFGILASYMEQFGCEKFATGHYARVGERNGQKVLLRAKDLAKDQSYVLYGITADFLAKLLLPLGEYTKEEIRRKAMAAGIEVAHKSDSQDICFVPNGDYMQVLEQEGLRHSHVGNFELSDGRKIGKHQGMACYTIGQRKGLGIAWEHPLYVINKNAGTNAVILGKDEELFTDKLICKDVNFLVPCGKEFVCSAKIRYKATTAECKVNCNGERCFVTFKEKQRAITAGQSVVFYNNELVLGGGIIE